MAGRIGNANGFWRHHPSSTPRPRLFPRAAAALPERPSAKRSAAPQGGQGRCREDIDTTPRHSARLPLYHNKVARRCQTRTICSVTWPTRSFPPWEVALPLLARLRQVVAGQEMVDQARGCLLIAGAEVCLHVTMIW